MADSVSVGTLGRLIFDGSSSLPSGPPTNSSVIVVGSSSYAVLTPLTNAVMQLSASTADPGGITLAVYSRQFLYSLVAINSSKSNGTQTAAVSFDATGGVVYDVQITGQGSVTLTYGLGLPPAFNLTVESHGVPAGCPVTLAAGANGIPAPAYQWLFNGTNVPGATNATLALGPATFSVAGTYRVVASNFLASAVSPDAQLTVVPVQLGPATLAPNQALQFTASGLAGQIYAIQSSTDLNNWMTVFTGPAGPDGTLPFTDPQGPSNTPRFFRIESVCN